MTGLRIRNADAVQQDGDLLAGAAAQADVRLDPLGTTLPDVYAHGELEQVIDIGCRDRGDGQAVQHGHDAHALAQEGGEPVGRDDDAFELLEPGAGRLLRPDGPRYQAK